MTLQAHSMQCDRCRVSSLVTTTKDQGRARQIAERWKWVSDTPRGDLCPRCAGLWQLGMFGGEEKECEGLGHGSERAWAEQSCRGKRCVCPKAALWFWAGKIMGGSGSWSWPGRATL